MRFDALESKEMKMHWVRMFSFPSFCVIFYFSSPGSNETSVSKYQGSLYVFFVFYFFTKKNETSIGKNTIIQALKKKVIWLKIFSIVGKS